MPAFIRTPADEARWSKAKEAANKQRSEADGDRYWGLVNHIYQNMKKAELVKSLHEAISSNPDVFGNNVALLDKVLNTLLKARGDEDEENEGPSHQDYEIDESDLPEGMRIDEDPYEDEDDEASKWLKEHGEKPAGGEEVEAEESEEPQKVKRSSGYSDWKPQQKYAPEHEAKMKELMDNGYSHREAERMAGAHQGPRDFQSALKHTVKPSQPSPKMLGELKELAGHWLDRARTHEKLHADPEKNPQKFAAGKMLEAHGAHAKNFENAYDDFLNSDNVKGLKGLARHKAIQAWKSDWKEKNPEYNQSAANVSDAQRHYKEASGHHEGGARRKSVDEALQHILGGGQTEGAMGMQEAAQHVGGEKGEAGYTATTIKDPSASFAESNPEFVNVNRKKQELAAPTAPPKPKGDPMAIIRRRANPDQLDRLARVQSARAAQGVGKKTEGAE
jgi:hypothetical protein